jgi:hypothetical protein
VLVPGHKMTAAKPVYARSAQMAAALRGAFLYSEKRARDCVFIATETALANMEKAPTLASLIRSTLHAARAHAKKIQFELLNSETVTRAVFNAMLQADVLLGLDGQSIRVDLRAHAACVGSLSPDFRDETESFLLEFVIGAVADIRPRDHLSLAHVLFRQFDPNIPMADLEDRLALLLAGLSDRIELSPTGIYVARHTRVFVAAGST